MKIRFLFPSLLSYYFFFGSGLASSQNLSTVHLFNDQPSAQVSIRLFTESTPDCAIFTVNSGQYLINSSSGISLSAGVGESLIITRYRGRIYVKKRNNYGCICDSVEFKGLTGKDFFSLRGFDKESQKRSYSGDLKCFPDMETLLLINTCDVEDYIAGVVKSEGGGGKYEEYFRTQAIIARTYTYKYFNKHILDRYNLCDDTHCQAFDGLTEDTLIINSVRHTNGMVITTPDSILIISAFHSNCGGETSPSEFAWVTGQSYLRRVVDPFCQNSRSALWKKKISIKDWIDFLRKNGYSDILGNPSVFNFIQTTRVPDYISGSFTLPLQTVRNGFDLRSTFFSVSVNGDSLLIAGRGYGHGVGLCQEGAMVMASKGFKYPQIIKFYYSGVDIIRIEDCKKNEDDKLAIQYH